MTEAPYSRLLNDPRFMSEYFVNAYENIKESSSPLDIDDIRKIAKAHYNWINDAKSNIYFDVLASVETSNQQVLQDLPRLENGEVKAIIYLVDINNQKHWTPLIIAEHGRNPKGILSSQLHGINLAHS